MPQPRTISRKAIVGMYRRGMTTGDIAEATGHTNSGVYKALVAAGVHTPLSPAECGKLAGNRGRPRKLDHDEIIRLHIEEKLSPPQIAKRLNYHRNCVWRVLHQHDAYQGQGNMTVGELREMRLLHTEHGIDAVEIADRVGRSAPTVREWLKRSGCYTPSKRVGKRKEEQGSGEPDVSMADLPSLLDSLPESQFMKVWVDRIVQSAVTDNGCADFSIRDLSAALKVVRRRYRKGG
ncbi:MAG: hypothetical protein EA376_00895 [Phycisphaeraceae bacterium]|nr:MAG: hypothetical protein EA376_00895 [Phycisphaeraceae bacterium]